MSGNYLKDKVLEHYGRNNPPPPNASEHTNATPIKTEDSQVATSNPMILPENITTDANNSPNEEKEVTHDHVTAGGIQSKGEKRLFLAKIFQKDKKEDLTEKREDPIRTTRILIKKYLKTI